jgi:hypothetical protein
MGIKTGITDAAGPCLAACLPVKNCDIVIIVLNCLSLEHRLIFIYIFNLFVILIVNNIFRWKECI